MEISGQVRSGRPEDEVVAFNHAWDRAMVTNDADAIGEYMADEWAIIGPDGSVGDKWWFLDLVRSGRLRHEIMETHEPDLRLYGDTAVLIGRGLSVGEFAGVAFHFDERVSCVFVRRDGMWRCVNTHLSQIADDTPA